MVIHSGAFLLFLAFGFVIHSVQTRLPPEEIEALKSIARAINKTNWDFSVDPCGQGPSWVTPNAAIGYENSVWCNNCSNDGSVCHVTSIVLKSQNLVGMLPPEMAKLPFLQEIDLTRNYISGSIPKEWAVLPLVNFSLLGNHISGQIPAWIGNITTLRSLVLEANQLTGALPKQLGYLNSLELFQLSSNFFSGELPDTFANLTNLKYFLIRSNNLNGKIPHFIQNWTQLLRLDLQASGLEGPIPSGFFRLSQLDDLRISDIVGNSGIPRLEGIEQLRYLTLRNCGISGEFPNFLVNFQSLKRLDLSYNKLSGSIPTTFKNLAHINVIFLTGNSLSGPVPDWMLLGKNNIDLSYNNFTLDDNQQACQDGKVNLLGSSLLDNMNKRVSCLEAIPCTEYYWSLNINCGGDQVTTVDNLIFESDNDGFDGVSTFHMGTNWAVSSSGAFLDSSDNNNFIAKTRAKLSMPDSELYVNARVSPQTLSYYGLCLLNGNYSAKLHFAEIIIADYNGYSSPGRRIFDVYVQGELVLKDFNIKDEANGSGKAVVKEFNAIVTQNKLEIRFNWAGKGTTIIPTSGTYGPLISAISVHPNFKPPSKSRKHVIRFVGILVLVLCLIILLLYAIWKKGYFRRRDSIHKDLKRLDLQTGSFSLRQIRHATNNFSASNKIGQGGFGPVYRGLLSDGAMIAVKQLSSKSTQGNREFLNEIGMISALQHPNLVKLYGCCAEGNQLLLVYEYMENNSLANALFGPEKYQLNLDWSTRQKICVGIARGLAYLHESTLSIVHRDIKPNNVLLDRELNPKISDFGLAKLNENEHTHISTRIVGTMGYMAPEYVTRGYLTVKADVYSFGIVALEIVTGKSVTNLTNEGNLHLLDWAQILREKGELLMIVDKKLGLDFDEEEALRMIKVAMLCSDSSPARRPAMSTVVSMLTSDVSIPDYVPDSDLLREHLVQEIDQVQPLMKMRVESSDSLI